MLDAGGSLHQGHDLILHIARHLNDIAAVENVDDYVDDDLLVDKLDLDALVDVLEADELRKLRPGGIGKARHAFDLTDGGFDNVGDHFFGDVDAALFSLAADIIVAHG